MITNSHNSIEGEMERYFATVTRAELLRDLQESDFDFYNQIGSSLIVPRTLGSFSSVSVNEDLIDSLTSATPSRRLEMGNYERMPLAA